MSLLAVVTGDHGKVMAGQGMFAFLMEGGNTILIANRRNSMREKPLPRFRSML
ncbi:MAG: hypothetical protein ACRCTD_02755 [Beijerinckiaceae bacterium]